MLVCTHRLHGMAFPIQLISSSGAAPTHYLYLAQLGTVTAAVPALLTFSNLFITRKSFGLMTCSKCGNLTSMIGSKLLQNNGNYLPFSVVLCHRAESCSIVLVLISQQKLKKKWNPAHDWQGSSKNKTLIVSEFRDQKYGCVVASGKWKTVC
jgi:hypothetical protein